LFRGRHSGDHMVVGFTPTCEIRAYHHLRCEFESPSWKGILDKTIEAELKITKPGTSYVIAVSNHVEQSQGF
jgi:hypothetical protein